MLRLFEASRVMSQEESDIFVETSAALNPQPPKLVDKPLLESEAAATAGFFARRNRRSYNMSGNLSSSRAIPSRPYSNACSRVFTNAFAWNHGPRASSCRSARFRRAEISTPPS